MSNKVVVEHQPVFFVAIFLNFLFKRWEVDENLGVFFVKVFDFNLAMGGFYPALSFEDKVIIIQKMGAKMEGGALTPTDGFCLSFLVMLIRRTFILGVHILCKVTTEVIFPVLFMINMRSVAIIFGNCFLEWCY